MTIGEDGMAMQSGAPAYPMATGEGARRLESHPDTIIDGGGAGSGFCKSNWLAYACNETDATPCRQRRSE